MPIPMRFRPGRAKILASAPTKLTEARVLLFPSRPVRDQSTGSREAQEKIKI
jgi:hypothetical protein